ncbi:MAG: hypothetical protein ACE5EG_06200, partial [Thermoanaerobaculia bacterium]
GSFLEAGWGESQLFVDEEDRVKVRSFLKWRRKEGAALAAFAGIGLDADGLGGKDGTDSVQSYFGLTYDVTQLFDGS